MSGVLRWSVIRWMRAWCVLFINVHTCGRRVVFNSTCRVSKYKNNISCKWSKLDNTSTLYSHRATHPPSIDKHAPVILLLCGLCSIMDILFQHMQPSLLPHILAYPQPPPPRHTHTHPHKCATRAPISSGSTKRLVG